MSDPSLPLQKAVRDALKVGDAIVGGRIHDDVRGTLPEFPYITIGDGQVLPNKFDCIDGTETTVDVHIWSRAVGWPEAKNIVIAVLAALDEQLLTVVGHRLTVFEVEQTNYLHDPDGLTRHVALTFRALTEPA